MATHFGVRVKVVNNNNSDIKNVQVVLNAEENQLVDIGIIGSLNESPTYGLLISTGSADYWTVSYQKQGSTLWIADEKVSIKKSDAGQIIKIIIEDKKVEIIAPKSGEKGSYTAKTPS